MKMQYIAPEIEIVAVQAEGVIASSLRMVDDDESTVSVSRSRQHFWGEQE